MVPILIDGIVYGLQLSLLAVGITLIYGLGGVLNLAHGQFAVVAGVAAALLMGNGMGAAPASFLGVAAAGIFGLLIDRSLLVPAYRYRGEERLLLGLVLTLGLSFVIDGYLNLSHPNVSLTIRLPMPSLTVLGITIRSAAVVTSLLAILAFGLLFLFLRGTLLGKAIRSIIQNEVGAELCGISPSRTRTLIVALSGLLAGLAGVAQGLFSSLGTEMGVEFTILALIVAVVGGVRSINGTFVAGILLGVVNALASYYMGAYVTLIILLGAAMLTILIRPSGLLAYWT
ncbi:MAG: branched-chain amino acid ABC transporter permease [Deltaproteobacteria bacterium]|nr:branched-chain amino acid ABC transporter permease [Deltaproteobacteria bacterium]MBI3077051.1 branched-chain amino acid ABC transporter permease [Deltaproteobacteria bacterium]